MVRAEVALQNKKKKDFENNYYSECFYALNFHAHIYVRRCVNVSFLKVYQRVKTVSRSILRKQTNAQSNFSVSPVSYKK